MANTLANNVLYIDTTGYTYAGPLKIEGIKYIGTASGTALITQGVSGSGSRLWEETGTANVFNGDACINANDGIHVAIAAGVKLYIYLE